MASPHKKLIRHNFNAIYPCCRCSVNETGAGIPPIRGHRSRGLSAKISSFHPGVRRELRFDTAVHNVFSRELCQNRHIYGGATCYALLPCTVQLHRSRIAGGPYEGQAGVRGHQWRLGLQRPREWASARCSILLGDEGCHSLALAGAIAGTRRGSQAVTGIDDS